MRHYVVVFLESRMFPGTWLTEHFVRQEPREDLPQFPGGIETDNHQMMLSRLRKWQNEKPPSPAWTLEECLLGGVGMVTAIWYLRADSPAARVVRYQAVPIPVPSV